VIYQRNDRTLAELAAARRELMEIHGHSVEIDV
jgi:hypothetical protein